MLPLFFEEGRNPIRCSDVANERGWAVMIVSMCTFAGRRISG